MSNKIANLREERLKGRRHLAGRVRCMACTHEWVAVSEIGNMDGLQCPICLLFRGSFMGNIDPEKGDIRYVCNCGCASYFIKLTDGGVGNVICHGCGGIKGTFHEPAR